MEGQPDLNQNAPRPTTRIDDEQADVPTLDTPPRATADSPSFDRATAAEEDQRKNDTMQPGTPVESADVERKRQSGAI